MQACEHAIVYCIDCRALFLAVPFERRAEYAWRRKELAVPASHILPFAHGA